MFNHLNQEEMQPKRVVVLGASGFVGSSTARKLAANNIPYLAISRKEIDLSHQAASGALASLLQTDDALVVISAKAPCKNYEMLTANVNMMKNICDALIKQPVNHLIYISSDAVYADSMDKINEQSAAAPTSLHGAMHLAREHMLKSIIKPESLAILRPSLLYGAHDPHNGYGPNSFYRLAVASKAIELFGLGEEQRDHVYIEDVAEIIYLTLLYRSYGVLNITTGEVASFFDIATIIGQSIDQAIEVKYRPRNGVMPHNGYRAFDNAIFQRAFEGFKYTSLRDGMLKMHQNAQEII